MRGTSPTMQRQGSRSKGSGELESSWVAGAGRPQRGTPAAAHLRSGSGGSLLHQLHGVPYVLPPCQRSFSLFGYKP